jgi:ATP-binding cassette subfamily G (WHITE) protein 2 (PDR)
LKIEGHSKLVRCCRLCCFLAVRCDNHIEMAESDPNKEYSSQITSESHQNVTNETTQTYTSGQQTQSLSTSTSDHTDGIYRTLSGRETYYPDGHASRTRGTGAGLFCDHDGHQQTPAITTRASYGILPSQESHGNALQTEQEVPLEPVEKIDSSSSSDSSTRYSSNEQQVKRQGSSVLDHSSTDEPRGIMLERRNTRAEIPSRLVSHSQAMRQSIRQVILSTSPSF